MKDFKWQHDAWYKGNIIPVNITEKEKEDFKKRIDANHLKHNER